MGPDDKGIERSASFQNVWLQSVVTKEELLLKDNNSSLISGVILRASVVLCLSKSKTLRKKTENESCQADDWLLQNSCIA